MKFEKAYIPYGGYWSTPFTKWQGSLAGSHTLELAAQAGRKFLAQRDIPASTFTGLTLGMTVPQRNALYASPWLAALIGADGITGPWIAQACATGARVLASAAAEVDADPTANILTVTADRCSNSPHIYYPNPAGMGGTGDAENWVTDSFGRDPWAKGSMIQTAENVAAEAGISREEQDQATLVRYEQYARALADDGAFHRRFMLWPFEVMDRKGRKVLASVEGDEGVFATTPEGLARLRPVLPDGTVTFGSQTHPADGNCGMIVTSKDRARELSRDGGPSIRVHAYGQGRAKKGFMAMATVPAAQNALDAAGVALGDVKAIKTHNPFAVNDLYMAKEMGLDIGQFNNYGSSLVFGHPQGPTGTRLIIELAEELAILGGGYGLFVGCAAGDTAGAVVIEVGD